MKSFHGGCLCGAVRFEATSKPFFPHLCSCRMCQQWSGAPTMGWLEFPLSAFKWTKGKPTLFRSSKKSRRGFCATCGSSLCVLDDGYDRISISIGCLDNLDSVVPGKQHSFKDQAPAWWHVDVSRPKSKRSAPKA